MPAAFNYRCVSEWISEIEGAGGSMQWYSIMATGPTGQAGSYPFK